MLHWMVADIGVGGYNWYVAFVCTHVLPQGKQWQSAFLQFLRTSEFCPASSEEFGSHLSKICTL